jgi:XRE family aerobic/anaerobic benzoate catabolism transcriptional regulator
MADAPTTGRQTRADNALLAEVGQIVRMARAKRGMTRKALAQQSGTSERYLAQIETGEGNPSVLVLDALARALDLDLFDLLPMGDQTHARRRAVTMLRALEDADVAETLRALERGDAAATRARRITLVGLRGAGKSTLGQMLAGRLDCRFVELDKEIEREHGAPVAALFEVYGQATFRRYERACLDRIVRAHPAAVIAAAGGIVADETTFARLLETTHVIWLKASPADHMRRVMEQGDFRPMARNREAMNDLVAILKAREADYGRSHAQVETSEKDVTACVEELMQVSAALLAPDGASRK